MAADTREETNPKALCSGRNRDDRIFVFFALFLFGLVALTFFDVVLLHLRTDFPSQVALLAGGVVLLVNLLYSYLQAAFIEPGMPPSLSGVLEYAADTEACKWEKCTKCEYMRPPRTHHCSVCGHCVLKMDHHCTWLNNCVGFNNYSHFCRFLLYINISCIVVLLVCFDFMLDAFLPRKNALTQWESALVVSSWILCACALGTFSFLGAFHTYLVMTNQTTIEASANQPLREKARAQRELAKFRLPETAPIAFRNPYSLGLVQNCQEVFGSGIHFLLGLLLPWLGPSPSGDGCQFASDQSGDSSDEMVLGGVVCMVTFSWIALVFVFLVHMWHRVWS